MRKLIAGWLLGILTLPLLGLGMAWLGLLPSHANATPPLWERAIAQMALLGYVARHAPQVANPIAATDENLLAGMKLFRDACSGCHGDPSATSDYGASFYPNVPQFAKHPPRLPDYQLFWIIRNGIRYSGMSAWNRQWDNDEAKSDDHIWKVSLFLSRLGELPPAVDAVWRGKQP
jgi:mono/diheme cytochrome c family protein